MAKHELFPHGAGPEQVSAAIAMAQDNCREEMTGFNAMRKPERPFASVEEFVRFKLWKASKTAFEKMAPLLDGATVFRVTLTGSKAVREDRRFHANGLKTFTKAALREIGPAVAAYCANLHVDAQDYLHVDVTVVVRDEDVPDFKRRARTAHTIGWRWKLGVRANWCKVGVQGKTKEDLRRTLNYTMRFDRFRRKPSWTREAIRAIGVARASGFRQSRCSKFSRTNAGAANLLKRQTNLAGNSGGSNLRQTQVTTKNPNVASPSKKKSPGAPGRPPKRLHSAYRPGFRRDREARERNPAYPPRRSYRAKHLPRPAIAIALMSSTAVSLVIRPLPVGAARTATAADGGIRLLGRWKGASQRFSQPSGLGAGRRRIRRSSMPSGSGTRPPFSRAGSTKPSPRPIAMDAPFLPQAAAGLIATAPSEGPRTASRRWGQE